jgi:hypothetical protein
LTYVKVNKQTEAINTAWYTFGSKKELLEHGVIDKNWRVPWDWQNH